MSDTIPAAAFTAAIDGIFRETFDEVLGMYLDKGTSLFETLATISAEEASHPISATCANIAAQVQHTAYYLEVVERYAAGEEPKDVDWDGSWVIGSVTEEEWTALHDRLRAARDRFLETVHGAVRWRVDEEIGGAIAAVAHCAFHLGQIREALCTIQRRS